MKEKEIMQEIQKTISEVVTDQLGKQNKEEIKELISKSVEEEMKSMQKKQNLFTNSKEKKIPFEYKNKYAHDLIKEMKVSNSVDINEKTNVTTAESGAYGGYTVATELVKTIQHLMNEYGVARREMFVTEMSQHTLEVPTQATDLSVEWVAEAGSISDQNPVFGKATLSAKKLVANIVLSREIIEDTAVNLFDYLTERVSEGFAEAEDTQFFDGDGTTFTGLLQSTNVGELAMDTGDTSIVGDITADYLLKLQNEVPQSAMRNGKYYMHRSIFNTVRMLKDTNGQYIYQAPSQGQPAQLWNKPIVLVEAMPDTDSDAVDTSFVLFGDLRKAAWIGHKKGMIAEKTNAVNWSTDLIDIKFVERVGYVEVIPTAVAKLTTAAS